MYMWNAKNMPQSPLALRHYPESSFGGFTDIDGTMAFYSRVNALVDASSVVLDIGCGRGEYQEDEVAIRRDLRILRGKGRKVIGIDVDSVAAGNPYIDEFFPIEGERWPVPDSSIDLCVGDFVIEHVANPDVFFSEISRVLSPGGHVCLRTSNVLSYVGLASRAIPNKSHAKVLSKVQTQRAEEDVFPTVYKCNTVWKLRRLLKKHNLVGCAYGYEAEPSYLSFSRLAYFLGVVHQKLAPNFLKCSLFCFGEKPS